VWEIVVLVLCVVLAAFFNASEMAMLTLSRFQAERLVKQKRAYAGLLLKMRQNPHRLLATITIGNTLVSIAAAALATSLAIGYWGDKGVGIATGVTTFVVLIFGETVPKSMGVYHARALAPVLAPLLYVFQVVLMPVIWVSDAFTLLFNKVFGEPEKERVTAEEVSAMARVGEQDGHIKRREREMIQSVLALDDRNVTEIMTPRLDVFCLDMNTSIADVLDKVVAEGYSRIPVYDGRMDKMQGVVIVKDLLRKVIREGRKGQVKDVMQDVLFVPENKKLDSLMREFQRKKAPFAIVVDEHGLFIGIVSMEDVLEELVGEIYDENDHDERAPVHKHEDGSYFVSGKTLISELNEDHAFSLPESEDYDTLAGYLMGKLGRIPLQGDEVVTDGWRFTVNRVAAHRIVSVIMARGSPTPSPAGVNSISAQKSASAKRRRRRRRSRQ
jgi:putative hemolysin